MRTLPSLIALFAVQAFAFIPPGIDTKLVAGYPGITVYERPKVATPLPRFWESFFDLFRIPRSSDAALPFQRRVAILVGIGHYKYITPHLDYVSKDIERVRDYLLDSGGIDSIYVTGEGISPEELDDFMSDEIPHLLKPNDRMLFYYSGHGADPGTGRPVLQFQQAKPAHWGRNVLRVDQFEQWSGLLKAKHALYIYDACTAGEAIERKGNSVETRTAVTELSGNGSRIVVTAGSAKQQAWMMKESAGKQYSIFTHALLQVLIEGTVESRTRGFITIGQAVEEASVILADTTRHLGPGHEMKPSPVSIDNSRNGTFVFLYPNAKRPMIPRGDVLAMGISVRKGSNADEVDQEMELAYWKSIEPLNDALLFTQFCAKYSRSVFCPVARRKIAKLNETPSTESKDLTKFSVNELEGLASRGSRPALTQLGKAYEAGMQGARANSAKSIMYYKRASGLGDADASYRLGEIYKQGRLGVPIDKVEAATWFRKAAEGGDSRGMTVMGQLYQFGLNGTKKDDAQAATW